MFTVHPGYNFHLLTVLPPGCGVYTVSGSVLFPKDGADGLLSEFDGALMHSGRVHSVRDCVQFDCHATREVQNTINSKLNIAEH